MKITAQEEYGLRCILQLASMPAEEPLAGSEIARREGLSYPYVEKLLWTLKKAGLTRSHRGVKGGYVLVQACGSDQSRRCPASVWKHLGHQRYLQPPHRESKNLHSPR